MEQNQKQINKKQSTLEKEGFLTQEARFYAKMPIPLTSAGMQRIRRFRQATIRKAIKQGIPKDQMKQYIMDSYYAKGFVEQGKIQPSAWNSAVFDELEKPVKERKSVAISPAKYGSYKSTVNGTKLSPSQRANLVAIVPATKVAERLKDYNYLVHNHYSPTEALRIVTATTKDKEGNTRLQSLNLSNSAWKQAVADRKTWYNQQVIALVKKGWSKQAAGAAVIKEIDKWYKNDKRRNPFDEIELISPMGKPKPDVNFAIGLKQRAIKNELKKQQRRRRR